MPAVERGSAQFWFIKSHEFHHILKRAKISSFRELLVIKNTYNATYKKKGYIATYKKNVKDINRVDNVKMCLLLQHRNKEIKYILVFISQYNSNYYSFDFPL